MIIRLVSFCFLLKSLLVFCQEESKQISSDKTSDFSGFYEPDQKISAEDFSAAWLVSKSRFMQCEDAINVAPNMAGVTFATVRNNCKNCHTLLTRDYFDFMVEHLSCASNQIPFGNKDIYSIMGKNLQETASKLQNMKRIKHKDKRLSETLGVLVFSPISFSVGDSKENQKIRYTYFEATFFSVYRYFQNVVIFVANEVDAQSVRDLSLPFLDVLVTPVPLDYKNRTVTLPRTALQTIINGTKAHDPRWEWVKYIYFSEGDQIVHLRGAKNLYDAIDTSDGQYVIVPHRMQTLPLRSTFPTELQEVWGPEDVMRKMPPETEVITESLYRTKGSCCDNGRRQYKKCDQNWWYTCPHFGLPNFTQWLRIGKSGYTFPPSTEHKGVCTYSAKKRLCPIPEFCKYRVPVRTEPGKNGTFYAKGKDICEEMPIVENIGEHYEVVKS